MSLKETVEQEFFPTKDGFVRIEKSKLKASLIEKKYVDIRYSGKKRGFYATKASE